MVVNGKEYALDENNTVSIEDKGTFSFTQTEKGAWTYRFEADAATQAGMKEGDSETLEFSIKVKDDSATTTDSAVSGPLSVTIEGTNAAPQTGAAALTLNLGDLVPGGDFSVSSDREGEGNLPLQDVTLPGQTEGDSLSYAFEGMKEGERVGRIRHAAFQCGNRPVFLHAGCFGGEPAEAGRSARQRRGTEGILYVHRVRYAWTANLRHGRCGAGRSTTPNNDGSFGDKDATEGQMVFGGTGD